MPYINVHDITAYYEDIGHGVPILMVHAATTHGGQWDQVRCAMPRHFRYILPDLFNCGKTANWRHKKQTRDLTCDEEADIILGAIDAIGINVHLVGHSYGGAVALRVALRKSTRIKSLCLIEPGGCPLLFEAGLKKEYEEYIGVMEAFLTTVANDNPEDAWRNFLIYYRGQPEAWDNLDKPTQAKIIAKSQNQKQVYKAQITNPTTLADLRSVEIRTAIVTGELTTAPERGVCHILEQYMPNANLQTIPGARHPMPVSHPGEVAALLCQNIKNSNNC